MVVQHNIPALNSYRNLGINNSNLAKNLEKLSSGYRINRAGDDAAGLAISEKMRGQIRGLNMAEQNAENGISLIQTAEGGLNETHDILQRMRELAVQSSNGTYQDEDRQQIELEYQALKQEIDRIASYTNYNGIKLLDGTTGGVMLSNTSAAEQLQGTNTQLLTILNINPSAATPPVGQVPTVAFQGTPTGETVAGQVTADDKRVIQDLGVGDTDPVEGFTDFVVAADDLLVTGTSTAKVDGLEADTSLGGVDTTATFTLTKTTDGWTATVSSANETINNAKVTFEPGSTNSYVTVETEDGKGFSIDLGAYVAANVGKVGATGENLGGYAAGTTIAFDTHLQFVASTGAAGDNEISGISVNGETVSYAKAAAAVSDADLTFSWDAENKTWNISGTGTVTDHATTASATIFEEAEFSGSIKAGSSGNTDVVATLKDGSKVALQFDNTQFKLPTEEDLSHASINVNVAGTTVTVKSVEAYKYDAPANASPDQLRADKMLDAMGLTNASKFDVNRNLENGTTAEKALWDSLNGKDAYIITRESTASEDRNLYNADTQYETILQVNGESYHGVQDGSNIVFKTDDGTTVATLTMASAASETGTVRFNIGDIYKSDGKTENEYYDSFLVNKEGAQIGSENQAELVFQIGANGTEDQRVGMYVLNMSSDNLGNHAKGNFVSDSSIATRDMANIAVDTLDHAINYVSSQRANLGALQNRLEHTLNNLGVTKENLTAAESSIRDTDMAEEMMEYTKNNILSQAAQAMLAQANQLPQGVLQLLG